MRCDECGKFRKAVDCVTSDHGDQQVEMKTECVDCMSGADYEHYRMAEREGRS